MSVRHIVMWKLAAENAETRDEHAREMARRLEALVRVIPGILSFTVSFNTIYPEKNWDLVLDATYEDAAALEAYQVHPQHQDVAAYVRSVVADRASVDFEIG